MNLKLFHYVAVALVIVGVIFISTGFGKITQYNNPDSEETYYDEENESVNAYVGGDAYNYIINGTRTTAYFVLGGSAFIAAALMLVLQAQLDTQQLLRRSFDEKDKEEKSVQDVI